MGVGRSEGVNKRVKVNAVEEVYTVISKKNQQILINKKRLSI